MIKEFKTSLTNDEKSQNTVEKYIRDILRFATFIGEQTPNKSLIMAYKAKLKEGFALSSANSMIAAVNSFLKFAGRLDLCEAIFVAIFCF